MATHVEWIRAYASLRAQEDAENSITAGVLADVMEMSAENPEFDAIDHIAYVFGSPKSDRADSEES